MKKILSILLAVAVVFSFAACSNGPEYTFYGKEVASVTLSSAPAYLKGETVNPSDVSLRVVFDDGTETTVTGQDVGMKTSDEKFVMDEDGLTFDFNYGVDKDNKAQKHSIEIKPVTLTGLQIDPADAAKAIAKNAVSVDTTGLVYTAVYDGGSKEISATLAKSLVTGLNFSVPAGLATAEVEDELTITPDTVSGNVKPVMTSDWVVKVVEDPKAVVGVRVEQNVDGHKPGHMISHHRHLQPGSQIIEEAESGASDGEHILQKALLPVAGPEIQIIHIESPDFHPSVDPHGKAQKKAHKNHMVLPLVLLFHAGKADGHPLPALLFPLPCLLIHCCHRLRLLVYLLCKSRLPGACRPAVHQSYSL